MADAAAADRARNALRALGLWDGRAPLRLRLASSPEQSNVTFEARSDARDVALRLPGVAVGEPVDRAGENAAQALAFRIGVGAEPLAFDLATGVMATRWIEGAEPLARDRLADDHTLLRRAAGLLRRLHVSEASLPTLLEPAGAIDRYVAGLGAADRAALWTPAVARAVARSLHRPGAPPAPCHGDPVPANFLLSPSGLVLIDWEYAGMADPAWDLGYLACEAALDERAVEVLAQAYGDPLMPAARIGAAMIPAAAVAALWSLLKLRVAPAPAIEAACRVRCERLRALAARQG